jgi:alpha/beta superfamily hydrolase
MDRKHAVTFENRAGRRLVGILHEPLQHAKPLAIILLSPGVKTRVAPHRMYNKMADRFVADGFWVLRFDFEGLGDADGDIGLDLMADLYGSIQLGRYVDDTCAAMDWLVGAHGIRRFVLGGLCGGAITGVLAAASRPDVEGILALGLPVMVDGSNVDKVRQMTHGQLQSLRSKYASKLLSLDAWKRLLTMKSDVRLVRRALLSALPGRNPAKRATVAPAARAAQQPLQPDNANPLFPAAFARTLERGCPVLLMFSESDRLYWEFREKFAERHPSMLQQYAELIDLQTIPQANHVLTFSDWQQDMLDRASQWLTQIPSGGRQRRTVVPAPSASKRVAAG